MLERKLMIEQNFTYVMLVYYYIISILPSYCTELWRNTSIILKIKCG